MNPRNFIRTAEGGVSIKLGDCAVTMTADEWAAIVAAVSAYGDDPAAVEFARLFHAGELDTVPPFRRRVDAGMDN